MKSLDISRAYVDWMIKLGQEWYRENASYGWVSAILSRLHEFHVDRSKRELQLHSLPHPKVYFNREANRPAPQYFVLRPPSKHSSRTVYLFRPRVYWEQSELHRWEESCDALLRMCIFSEEENGDETVFHYGQRFECPEPAGARNATAHVQMLHDGVNNSWIDDEIPATPIRADEPHEVVLCALAGLYGAQELYDLALASGIGILKGAPMDSLKSYLERIGLET